MEKEKCFIVMPITTPRDLIDRYSGDEDHFLHVLEHLFKPAIHKAGFEPISPKSKGSDLIHAEIIQNIEKSEYLLCDMSILNPNVFFELGIRTAINRPIALVKDDLTKNIPFDTNIINNHTYTNSLNPWTLENEIDKLSEHLLSCFKADKKDNSLWKYFSLSAKAKPIEAKTGENEKLEYISMQINALRNEIREKVRRDNKQIRSILDKLIIDLFNYAGSVGNEIKLIREHEEPFTVEVITEQSLPNDVSFHMFEIAEKYGYEIVFRFTEK